MNHAVGWEKVRTKLSFAYTQTIIRLYPNNRVPILKLKRKKYDTISYIRVRKKIPARLSGDSVFVYCFSRLRGCWGARALLVASVYSLRARGSVALMSRLENPKRN